ncbi:MAG: DUF4349 domain-containing protein [bacterium]|nr:DUF4349 domain-containing protein [bacterium]
MYNNYKKCMLITIVLIFLSLLGCASSGSRVMNQDSSLYSGAASPERSGTESIPENTRVIILNANLTLEVDDPAPAPGEISKIAKQYNGYVLSSGNRRVVIRVEAKSFQAAISGIGKLGELTDKNIYGKDVTGKFRDSQIRLDNKLNARKRYLELLKKAENVEAALKVEKELERLNGEIESFKGVIKRLSHLSQYSTITVIIEEEVTPGPVGYIFWGLYKGIKWLFVWD